MSVRVAKAPKTNLCPITGLLTGAPAREALTRSFAEAIARGDAVSLALVDVDEFRGFNKALGAERADALLKAIAKRVTGALPDRPWVRLAGDCFAVLLPESEPEEALLLLQGVRAAVARASVVVGRGAARREAHPTVSVGVASGPRDGDTLEAVLSRAQSALRRAKALGRDRVASPPDDRMVMKTSYYALTQLERLKALAAALDVGESTLLREALEDLLMRYKDRRPSGPAMGSK